MSKKEKSEVTFEIIREIGYLSEKGDKILAEVSWNGNPSKIELRKCYTDREGNLRLASGIGLTDEECETFVRLYGDIKEDKVEAVNFDEIFADAVNIIDKRRQGYATVDGFIVLKHRPSFKLSRWKNKG